VGQDARRDPRGLARPVPGDVTGGEKRGDMPDQERQHRQPHEGDEPHEEGVVEVA
jgi:hypothetical protein